MGSVPTARVAGSEGSIARIALATVAARAGSGPARATNERPAGAGGEYGGGTRKLEAVEGR